MKNCMRYIQIVITYIRIQLMSHPFETNARPSATYLSTRTLERGARHSLRSVRPSKRRSVRFRTYTRAGYARARQAAYSIDIYVGPPSGCRERRSATYGGSAVAVTLRTARWS
eukprot:COSAG02_NODE_1295_length_13400_cov_5.691828_6_plen_113_part_00